MMMDLDFEKAVFKRKRSNLADDDHRPPATGLENLPSEIIDDILLRLPITSLVQFKCVCRSWRALAQDPRLKNMYSVSRIEKFDPCLIIHCDVPIRSRLNFVDFAAGDEERGKVKRIHVPFSPSMPEFDVVGSCNGLLLLSDLLYTDPLYVYNPFSGDYAQLPKSLQYPDQEVVFGFGFHPKTKKYKVIKVIYYRNNGHGGYPRARRIIYPQSEVQILTVGNPMWRSLGKISYRLVRRPSEALVNGRLHWVTRPSAYNPSRRLVSFDLDDEQFTEVPKPACGGLNRYNYNAVVLRGCLAASAYCNHGRMEIWVMKEYNVVSSWVKEYSIGSCVPVGLKRTLDRPYKSYKTSSRGRLVRVICLLKNGELLLEYKGRALVSYDPNERRFKDLMLQGLPNLFETVAHVGSLNWIDTPL